MISTFRSLAQRGKRFAPLLASPAALLLTQAQAKAALTYYLFEKVGNVEVQAVGSLTLPDFLPPSIAVGGRLTPEQPSSVQALTELAINTKCKGLHLSTGRWTSAPTVNRDFRPACGALGAIQDCHRLHPSYPNHLHGHIEQQDPRGAWLHPPATAAGAAAPAAFASLLLALGCAALAQRPGVDRSLLQELQWRWQRSLKRFSGNRGLSSSDAGDSLRELGWRAGKR